MTELDIEELFYQRPTHLSLTLMRCGVLPSPAEEMLLRKHAAVAAENAEDILEELQSPNSKDRQEIARLQATHQLLALLESLHNNAFKFVPARSLPSDILSLIFLEYVRSSKHHYRVYQTSRFLSFNPNIQRKGITLSVRINTPWTLGMVCKRWRDVACSTSGLWSFIHVALSTKELDSGPKHDAAAFCVKTFIERSGGRPLEVKITLADDCNPNVRQPNSGQWGRDLNSHPILNLICQESSRWAHVDLNITENLLESMQTLARGNLPLLRHLKATVSGASPRVFDIFSVAPQLRRIELRDDQSVTDNRFLLPWNQIETIDALTLNEASVEAFCASSHELRKANLHFTESSIPGTFTLPVNNPSIFVNLKSLTLTGSCRLLLAMHSTALESLDLSRANISSAQILPSICLRSLDNLKELSIGSLGLDGDGIMRILRSLPRLSTLELLIDDQLILEHVLRSLSYGDHHHAVTPPLPRLVDFGALSKYAEITAVVLDFLSSRSPGSQWLSESRRPLSTARLHVALGRTQEVIDGVVASIEQLRSSGLRITGHYRPHMTVI